MDKNTQTFISTVYNTILKPYPEAKESIIIITPGYLHRYSQNRIISIVSEKYAKPVIEIIQDTIWLDHPEITAKLGSAMRTYLLKTAPTLNTLFLYYSFNRYSFNRYGIPYYSLTFHTEYLNNITPRLITIIPLEATDEDIQSHIIQSIQQWKINNIDMLYSSKTISTPTSKQSCDDFTILQQGMDLTCWANTVINAFLISKHMRRIAISCFHRYKKEVLDGLPLERQHDFYNPDKICILPQSLSRDGVTERFAMMQFVYKSICFYTQTILFNNKDPVLKWNRHLASTFKKTHGSLLSKISQVFKHGNIGFISWAIKGFLKNIYGEKRYAQCVVEDVKYDAWINGSVNIPEDTEFVLTGVVASFPIKKEIIKNGQRYVLDHCALFLRGLTYLHYLAGVLCNDMPYIIDTSGVITGVKEMDWVNGDVSLIHQHYGNISVQFSYACYVKDIRYETEPEIDCSIIKKVAKQYYTREILKQLPPVPKI